MSLNEQEIQQLKKLLSKLSPVQAQQVGVDPTIVENLKMPEVPSFQWNSNLVAFKAILRKLLKENALSETNLVKYLQSQGLVTESATVDNYGYVYPETGIFAMAKGMVTLTEVGKQIAELCTDSRELTPFEVVVFRGLQQQSAGYTYLSIIGSNPGIFREDLIKKMQGTYKPGNSRYYVGYYTRIFKQLKLVKRTTENGKARYWLTVPEAWELTPPDVPEDEE